MYTFEEIIGHKVIENLQQAIKHNKVSQLYIDGISGIGKKQLHSLQKPSMSKERNRTTVMNAVLAELLTQEIILTFLSVRRKKFRSR